MADNDNLLEEEAMCTVCLELYNDPVLLDCTHNLCAKCAKQLYTFETKVANVVAGPDDDVLAKPPRTGAARGQQLRTDGKTLPSSRITCPECRHVTPVPEDEGVDGMKRNLVLKNMVTTLRERKESRAHIKCGICEEKEAQWECRECQFEMCAECRETDHRRGRYKEHAVFPIGKVSKMRPRKCREHDRYLTDLFCTQCSVPVCLLCNYMGSHKGHPVEPITEAVDRVKQRLVDTMEEVKAKHAEVKASVKELEDEGTSKTVEACDAAALKVRQYFSSLHELLTTRQEHLMAQIDEVRASKTAQVNTGLAALRAILEQMDDAVATSVKVTEQSHFSDLLRAKDSLLNRLQTLAAVKVPAPGTSTALTSVQCLTVSFDATDATIRRLLADVGSIATKDSSSGPGHALGSRGATTLLPMPRATPVALEPASSTVTVADASPAGATQQLREGSAYRLMLDIGGGGGLPAGSSGAKAGSMHRSKHVASSSVFDVTGNSSKRSKGTGGKAIQRGGGTKSGRGDGGADASNNRGGGDDDRKWVLKI